ncbi:MAG: 50S ribosomal protein L4 [Bacteroidetes bacterium]|jgi:large subunit ribosomal protein L4|nr:50S ribosomal protein L4 [Bacteroidota bacterium]MDF1867486.1 50S ribosomal protein L4 [Saprospiraceae bacterium]
MKLDVLNIQGEKTGRSIDLPADIFGVEPNEHAVWLYVKAFLANQRQGTHKSKERGEIAGSRRKIKRQKGTGTARAGDIKSPVFRGGGRAFGPKPRDYRQKMNKKVKQLARKSALSSKAADGGIMILEDFSFDAPKTSAYINILQNLKCSDKKTVLVIGEADNDIYLSSRNIQKSSVVNAADLNPYQILNANTLILSEGSIEKLKETFN